MSIASSVCDLTGAGEVFASDVVNLHLVDSGIATSEKGTHELKGVPHEWRRFAVGG